MYISIYIYIYIYFLSHNNVGPYITTSNFLFLLTFYCELLHNSINIVLFLKEKKIITSIKYCNCDNKNVQVWENKSFFKQT